MKIILLGGPPCSGKTTLASALTKSISNSLVIDDPKDNDIVIEQIAARPYDLVVICDPWFCDYRVRDRAKDQLQAAFPTAQIECRYMETDLDKCLENAQKRIEAGGHRVSKVEIKFFFGLLEMLKNLDQKG